MDVELDGAPWRTLPADAVVRSGLLVGRALDRTMARALARELRRSSALTRATRALTHRDRLAGRRPATAHGRRRVRAGGGGRDRHPGAERHPRRRACGDCPGTRLAGRGYGDAAVRLTLRGGRIRRTGRSRRPSPASCRKHERARGIPRRRPLAALAEGRAGLRSCIGHVIHGRYHRSPRSHLTFFLHTGFFPETHGLTLCRNRLRNRLDRPEAAAELGAAAGGARTNRGRRQLSDFGDTPVCR